MTFIDARTAARHHRNPRTRRRSLPAALLTVSVLVLPGTFAVASADAASVPRCLGHRATIVGTSRADHIHGTAGNDVIVALGGDDTIYGDGGNDIICGGPGNDVLDGGRGNDRLSGDAGNDILDGDAGSDRLFGGAGRDHLDSGVGADGALHGGPGADVIVVRETRAFAFGDGGNDRLSTSAAGTELDGDAGNDVLTASVRAVLAGDDGDDRITGSPFNDLISGGAGNDRIDARGGNDNVEGDDGNDVMDGGAGNDWLDGGAGIDHCYGEGGSDQCNGGAPGTYANTPSDPDICEAEVMVSCHETDLPAGWRATLRGTSTSRDGYGTVETTEWTMATTLHLEAHDNGIVVYTDDIAARSGQWSTKGSYPTANGGSCTVEASGSMTDRDLDLIAHFLPGPHTYGLDWGGLGAIEDTATCGSEVVRHVTRVDAGEQFDGERIVRDTSGTITGKRTFTDDNGCTEVYSYSLAPLD
ncbi:MAG: calcium-binding protein [Jatrophihabitans sp.]|uniref:calcium-binding protein n=1 Tax=Jatrophihabitans sp. TaxID=1932789 RepID=UPI003F81A1C9